MKKLKKLILTTVMLALSVSLLLGSLGGIVFAGTPDAADYFFAGGTMLIKETVEYGETAKLPKEAGVPDITGPDGKPAEHTLVGDFYEFDADKLGYYVVKYSNAGSDYVFKILSESKDEWVLEVADNGADIPTVIKVGGTVKIPAAKAVVYDKKDNTKVVKTDADVTENVDVDVFDKNYAPVTLTNNTFTASAEGSYFVRYSFKAGSGQSHYISKDFTIKAQTTFADTDRPSINVASIAKEHNLNTPLILPKATVTDNYDENVKVVVTVKVGEEDVKQVEVDEDYDYAVKELSDAVVFDNNKTMKFYPTKGNGEMYRITYTAYDDAGNPSQERNFTVEVYDKLAPSIKVEESQIPREWGASVKNKAGAADNKITFPFPEIRDNSQVKGSDDKFDNSTLKVEFTIRDTVADKEVIKFANILDQANGGNEATPKNVGGTNDGTTTNNTKHVFGENGLDFLFNTAFTSEKKSSTYSITYKATDNGNYDRSLSYTLGMSAEYTDTGLPTITWNDMPAYFVVDDEDFSTFTVPDPIVRDVDKPADRVRKDITLTVGTEDYVLKAGDEIEFTDALKLTKVGESTASLVDFTGENKVVFALRATDSVGNKSDLKEYTVKLVNKTSSQVFGFDITKGTVTDQKVGDIVTAFTDLTISGVSGAALDNLNFTGFEIIVKHKDDTGVSAVNTRSVVYYDETAGTINISKCTFVPSKPGDYIVIVRAFDFGGRTAMFSFALNGIKGTGNITVGAASTTTVAINSSFTLDTYTFRDDVDVVPHYRVISGPQYSLMGRELVSKASGAYNVNFLPIVETNDASTAWHTEQNFTTSNQETPVINIVDRAKMYEPSIDERVYLPDATVISKNGVKSQNIDGQDRDYTLTVKNKKGDTVPVNYDADYDKDGDGTKEGGFYFIPAIDGKFTVLYNVTGYALNTADYSYTMTAGDVTAPDFKVNSAHAASYKIDKNDFVFSALTLNSSDTITTVTFTKELIYPDGTVKTLSGTDRTAMEKTKETASSKGYTLNQSGTYTVRYTVKDAADNESKQEFTFTVAKDNSGSGVPMAVISTVLVVLAVLLIIGVGVYVWFRPVKDGKKQ